MDGDSGTMHACACACASLTIHGYLEPSVHSHHHQQHHQKQARGLLLKTLVLSLVVTAGIWAFPYEAIGWEPTNEHILVTVRASPAKEGCGAVD